MIRVQKGQRIFRSTEIISLERDAQKNIWAATGNGIFKYDAVKNESSLYLSSADPGHLNRFSKIYEAPSQPGILWLGSVSRTGLWRYDTKSGKHTTYNHLQSNARSLVNDTIYSMFEDKEKRLWIGTKDGLSLMNRESGEIYQLSNGTIRCGCIAGYLS
ncbi:MAG: two-component regulator propeller domain-containing protein [Chitinophagaceae bacterium]